MPVYRIRTDCRTPGDARPSSQPSGQACIHPAAARGPGRRQAIACGLVAGLVLSALTVLAASPAAAQAWPSRPVRIIVPAAPGGSSDPLARMVAEELTRSLAGSFVVENRPGANGNIGASLVAKAEPDGHTLLLGWTGTLVSAVTLYNAKPFHPQKDFEPIVLVGSIPNVVTINAKMPVRTLDELTAWVRARPGQLNFGSTGSGSSWHLSAELYKKLFGLYMVHVPYTSPAGVTTDLLGERLQLAFPGATAVAPFVRDGRMRVLAVLADKRSEVLPGVPSTAELGYPKLASETWMGLLAPKGTPAEITSRINAAVNAALANPEFRTRLTAMGYTPMGGTAAQFGNLIGSEITKWTEVVKFSGAKVD